MLDKKMCMYQVKRTAVESLYKLAEETGVKPSPHKRGRKIAFSKGQLKELEEFIFNASDRTLKEKKPK